MLRVNVHKVREAEMADNTTYMNHIDSCLVVWVLERGRLAVGMKDAGWMVTGPVR